MGGEEEEGGLEFVQPIFEVGEWSFELLDQEWSVCSRFRGTIVVIYVSEGET